jgi:hypothetical protein
LPRRKPVKAQQIVTHYDILVDLGLFKESRDTQKEEFFENSHSWTVTRKIPFHEIAPCFILHLFIKAAPLKKFPE